MNEDRALELLATAIAHLQSAANLAPGREQAGEAGERYRDLALAQVAEALGVIGEAAQAIKGSMVNGDDLAPWARIPRAPLRAVK